MSKALSSLAPTARRVMRRTLGWVAGGGLCVVAGTVAVSVLVFRYTPNPRRAALVVSDVGRFMALRPTMSAVTDTATFLDTGYFAHGSPGLGIYARMYGRDGDLFVRFLRRNPEYYDSIADLKGRVEAQFTAVHQAFVNFDSLYSRALFPPTYFVVGARGPGGANGYRGLYISADSYGAPDDAPLAGPYLQKTSKLPHLVAHELVHFNMALASPRSYMRDWSNLARAIKEGAADFIAELVSGDHINARAHAFGLAHEADLWQKFKPDMHGTETGEWFWVTPADSAQPQDIGYFLGYRIVQAWYQRAQGRPNAVADIIRTSDYERFLRESGYDPQPPS
jgi:hypothetical protein